MKQSYRQLGALASSLLLVLGFARASEKFDPLSSDFHRISGILAGDEPGEPPCIVPPAPPPPPDPVEPDQPDSQKPLPES